MSLLASKNEAHLLPSIIDEFDRYATRGSLRAAARTTSAVPLTDQEKAALEKKLRARYGSDLEFEYVVDPSILGGVVVPRDYGYDTRVVQPAVVQQPVVYRPARTVTSSLARGTPSSPSRSRRPPPFSKKAA